MIFNSDLSRQTQEVILSNKNGKFNLPRVIFDNIAIALTHFKKHLGVHHDINSNFNKYTYGETAK